MRPVPAPPRRRAARWIRSALGAGLVLAAVGCSAPSGATTGSVVATSSGTGSPTLTGHGRWTALPPGPLPPLQVTVGVWTGTELLVVGKRDALDDLPAVAAGYRPSTRSWRRLPDLPAKTDSWTLTRPAAVWTGREMVITGVGFLAALDPSRGSWRRLKDPGHLAVSTNVLSVWTGRRVLVLADTDGAWSYDPATDRWAALPEPPDPVGGAAAVWTGSELVVAGGIGANGTLAGPAQVYVPDTQVWRTTSVIPQGRTSPSAAWDGHEVILTGGRTNTRTAATQVALDPATGRWRTLAGGEAPGRGRREGHGSVWTGGQVLIWGGGQPSLGKSSGPTFITAPNGVAFDPVRGGWTPLPVSPLAGRSDAVVVWTGSQLLVWGGRLTKGLTERLFTDGAEYRE